MKKQLLIAVVILGSLNNVSGMDTKKRTPQDIFAKYAPKTNGTPDDAQISRNKLWEEQRDSVVKCKDELSQDENDLSQAKDSYKQLKFKYKMEVPSEDMYKNPMVHIFFYAEARINKHVPLKSIYELSLKKINKSYEYEYNRPHA